MTISKAKKWQIDYERKKTKSQLALQKLSIGKRHLTETPTKPLKSH